MGAVNNNVSTQSNYQTQGSQQGGAKSQAELEKMPTPDLVKHWQNSAGPEKEAAFAELQKRLGDLMPEKKAEKSPEKAGGEKAGGEKGPEKSGGGGGGSLEEILKMLMEKVKSGQPLTPEEQALADKLGLKSGGDANAMPDLKATPDQIPVNVAPPGPV